MKERQTRQLVATYDALSAVCDHPTADELLRRVRKVLPRVSLGTVYRNLEKMRIQGRIRILHLGGGVARYDAVVGEHDHFLCESCGAVSDVEIPAMAPNIRRLEREGYVVRMTRMALHGFCPGCARTHDAVAVSGRTTRGRRGRGGASRQRTKAPS